MNTQRFVTPSPESSPKVPPNKFKSRNNVTRTPPNSYLISPPRAPRPDVTRAVRYRPVTPTRVYINPSNQTASIANTNSVDQHEMSAQFGNLLSLNDTEKDEEMHAATSSVLPNDGNDENAGKPEANLEESEINAFCKASKKYCDEEQSFW